MQTDFEKHYTTPDFIVQNDPLKLSECWECLRFWESYPLKPRPISVRPFHISINAAKQFGDGSVEWPFRRSAQSAAAMVRGEVASFPMHFTLSSLIWPPNWGQLAPVQMKALRIITRFPGCALPRHESAEACGNTIRNIPSISPRSFRNRSCA